MADEVKYRSIPIDEDGNYVGPSKNQFAVFTGSDAMDETLALTPNSVIVGYKFHLSATQSASGSLTIKDDGSSYMFVNHDAQGDSDFGQMFGVALPMAAGSTLRAEFPNPNTLTWHLEITWREER